MKITFISPTINLSGGVRVMVIYAQYLMRMGHSVRIVSPPLRSIPLKAKLKSLLNGHGWPSDPKPLRSHLEGSGVDHHTVERWRPIVDEDIADGDIVIATWWETAEWVNRLSASKGAKVYFIQHHEVFPNLPVQRCRATYRFPMHKIVVARWLKDVMREEYGDETVDVVPNSVDRAQFFGEVRGKQANPTVGFQYTYHPFKGLRAALAAIQVVRDRIPNLRLLSFGDTLPIGELPLPEGTEFMLSPPQDHLRNIYAGCDAWVLASRSEGFGLTSLEAMACRTPLVATRTGWAEEGVKTGWNGVLVDVDDVTGLAEGIEWVLSLSDGAWRELSSNAAATVASSSWEQSALLFEKALKHACIRARRGEIAGRCNLPAEGDT